MRGKDGRMKRESKKTSFEVLSTTLKPFAGERDGAMHKWGGVGRKRGMTGMQKRLLLSPVALMWAEDKVRLEIGMPGARWEKREGA